MHHYPKDRPSFPTPYRYSAAGKLSRELYLEGTILHTDEIFWCFASDVRNNNIAGQWDQAVCMTLRLFMLRIRGPSDFEFLEAELFKC